MLTKIVMLYIYYTSIFYKNNQYVIRTTNMRTKPYSKYKKKMLKMDHAFKSLNITTE